MAFYPIAILSRVNKKIILPTNSTGSPTISALFSVSLCAGRRCCLKWMSAMCYDGKDEIREEKIQVGVWRWMWGLHLSGILCCRMWQWQKCCCVSGSHWNPVGDEEQGRWGYAGVKWNHDFNLSVTFLSPERPAMLPLNLLPARCLRCLPYSTRRWTIFYKNLPAVGFAQFHLALLPVWKA